jgi:hypothetical protein
VRSNWIRRSPLVAMMASAWPVMLTPCNSKAGGELCHGRTGADNTLDSTGEY